MRTTISVPDDLHEAARRMRINLSIVCERALRDAISNRRAELEAIIKGGENARLLLQELEQLPESVEQDGLTDRLLDGTQAR